MGKHEVVLQVLLVIPYLKKYVDYMKRLQKKVEVITQRGRKHSGLFRLKKSEDLTRSRK